MSGQEVDLTIIPDGLSHSGVGNILDGKYTEIFSVPVSDKLTTSFDVQVDGEYIICIIGAHAIIYRYKKWSTRNIWSTLLYERVL